MKVGIIGSGDVGRILAAGFKAKGHDVVVGARDPAKNLADTKKGPYGQPSFPEWAAAHPQIKVGSMADAARHGEALVLCVHGANVAEAIAAAGPDNLAGKLVLDTTNPLEFGPGGAHIPKAIKDSCLQTAQRAAPKAHLVKAWNCTPGASMVDPKQGKGDQFICGDDAAAKAQATSILQHFGWRVADVGDATMAPYIEGMALTVINWAAKANDWGWVLKMEGRQ